MIDPLQEKDLLHEPSFDETTRMAATLMNAPMAAISLLGKTCQWFKAEVGLNVDSTPIEQAFCRYTAASREVLLVPDARLDPRFVDNPLVTSGTIRSYAGAPLLLHDGSAIGALCVLDTKPRDFGEREVELLRVLAAQVISQLQLEALLERQAEAISDLEHVRHELKFQASHDPLTQLLNRRGLEAELDLLLAQGSAGRNDAAASYGSLIFIDLDGFKQINDQLGHKAGDAVLEEIGKRFKQNCPKQAVIARLGGDEFVVAVVHGFQDRPAESLVSTLVQAVAEPMMVAGARVAVTASAGLACAPVTSLRAADLIDSADRAMYTAKKRGGGQAAAWQNTAHAVTPTTPSCVRFVRDALRAERIEMAFQPVVDLFTGQVLRREALVRWHGGELTEITPSAFVAAAEHSGNIKKLGRIALSQACTAAAEWQRIEPGVGVAVNVSALQIDEQLVIDVSRALSHQALDPRLLTLELTETSQLDRSNTAIKVLNDLASIGVRLSLDDFGTGSSSMAMLCELPFVEAKIDRRFCASVNDRLMAVVGAAIDLSHSLGLTVVAEGIETVSVRNELIKLGCDAGQGFFYSQPEFLTPGPVVGAAVLA